MDKDKYMAKYGIANTIAILMQVQLVLIGGALIISGIGISRTLGQANSLNRLVVYCMQAVVCIAILVFGIFHFHKKKTVYFKTVLYVYAIMEGVRCAILRTGGVDDWAAIASRVLMIAISWALIILATHLGERKYVPVSYFLIFEETALYLVFILGFPGVTGWLYKLLPLVGILIAASICLFSEAKTKQKEYFDSLRAEGKLPEDSAN